MAAFLILILIFFSFLNNHCYLSHGSRSNDECPSSTCPMSDTAVRFPFRLPTLKKKSCGYPGFDLSCDSNGRTVINLPLSGVFVVHDFLYSNQTIWLRDPKGCLPRRLGKFNTSGSTLMVESYTNFTLFDCPTGSTDNFPGMSRVSCLSNGEYDVMAIKTNELGRLGPMTGCTNNWTLQVPSVPKDLEYARTLDTIGLTWDLPECASCERSHGTCRVDKENDLHITCSLPDNLQSTWLTKWEKIFGIVTPCLPLVMGILLCIIKKIQAVDRDAGLPSDADPEQGQHDQSPDSSTMGTGMDTASIASYPKFQISKNMMPSHLVKPREDVCTICLLEYRTNDTVKIMPDCDHYFHEDCIDRWLRTKATCPLCRKRQHHQQIGLSQSDQGN